MNPLLLMGRASLLPPLLGQSLRCPPLMASLLSALTLLQSSTVCVTLRTEGRHHAQHFLSQSS